MYGPKPRVTFSIYLDQRRCKANGLFPVKLRLTYRRQRKYIPLNVDLDPETYQAAIDGRQGAKAREWRQYFIGVEAAAQEIINALPQFSFEEFRVRFTGEQSADSVFGLFDERIRYYEQEGRISTAQLYLYARNSLRFFHRSDSLAFYQVTERWLNNYERWMLRQGKTLSTVGSYTRILKAVYNEAIRRGLAQLQESPFRSYKTPKSNNPKKALPIDQIRRVFEYQSNDLRELYAKDIWCFSYLCNGINIKDMAELTADHLKGNRLEFYRSKTLNTNRTRKPIIAVLPDEALEIIERHWQGRYLFGMHRPADDDKRRFTNVRRITGKVNAGLETISEALSIERFTFISARHSFATVLRNSGAPIAFISESLGHSSIKTTAAYLANFEDEARKEFTRKLTDWK